MASISVTMLSGCPSAQTTNLLEGVTKFSDNCVHQSADISQQEQDEMILQSQLLKGAGKRLLLSQ